MYLELKEIGPEGVCFDHVLALPPLDGAGGERVDVNASRVAGTLRTGSRGVELQAHLDATLEMPCSRCLDSMRLVVARDFFLTLVPQDDAAQASPDDAGDDTLQPFTGGRVELEPLATEQLYLSLPLKPICREGCKGLCPRCGANRNTGECGCVVEDVDPRLAPLLQFKKR